MSTYSTASQAAEATHDPEIFLKPRHLPDIITAPIPDYEVRESRQIRRALDAETKTVLERELTETYLKIADLKQEIKDWRAEHVVPLEQRLKKLGERLRLGYDAATVTCYGKANIQTVSMEYFDADGVLVDTRPLTAEERKDLFR